MHSKNKVNTALVGYIHVRGLTSPRTNKGEQRQHLMRICKKANTTLIGSYNMHTILNGGLQGMCGCVEDPMLSGELELALPTSLLPGYLMLDENNF